MSDARNIIEKFIEWLHEKGEDELAQAFDPDKTPFDPAHPADPPPEPPNIVLAKTDEETGEKGLTATADPRTTSLSSQGSPEQAAANKATSDRLTKLEGDVSDIRSGLDEILGHLRGTSSTSSTSES